MYIYKLDTAEGKLVLNDPDFVSAKPESGPRHVAFHPFLPFVYTANELDSTVAAYYFDSKKGELTFLQTLTTLPENVIGNTCAGVAVSPSGKFVYVSNRGHESVAVFSVNQDSGHLSPVDWEPTLGSTPRFITLDPQGQFLFVANEDSDSIVTFKTNVDNGKLASKGDLVKTGSPVCILFL